MENLTEEQKAKVTKLKKKFLMRGSLAVFLHISWLFCSNILTVLFNELYFHNQQFVFFTTLGSAVIIMAGLRNAIEDIGKQTTVEMNAILGKE